MVYFLPVAFLAALRRLVPELVRKVGIMIARLLMFAPLPLAIPVTAEECFPIYAPARQHRRRVPRRPQLL